MRRIRFMKNVRTIIFLTVLLSMILYSCGSDDVQEQPANTEAPESPAEQEETVAEDRSLLDDLEEFDFNGYEFTIYNRVNDGWANSRLDREELSQGKRIMTLYSQETEI